MKIPRLRRVKQRSGEDVRYALTSVRPGTDLERDRWNLAIARHGGHLLQSWQWGELKARHGWRVERAHVAGPWGEGMAQVLFRHRGPFSIAYVPRGPVITGTDLTRTFRELIATIDDICQRHRAISLVVEPNGRLGLTGSYRQVGFVRGPEPFQPARTVKTPLLPDEDLLKAMHSKHRYNIRLAERRGVTIERVAGADALDQFYALLRDTSERNQFGVHTQAYYADALEVFGANAAMLFAKVGDELAATAIVATFGSEAIYLYGASSTSNRGDGAAFLLQYEAMRWARDNGASRYDLWGIPVNDPAPLPNDATGVTRSQGDDQRGLFTFKVRFGGDIVVYPVTMERRYHPALSLMARRFGVLRG